MNTTSQTTARIVRAPGSSSSGSGGAEDEPEVLLLASRLQARPEDAELREQPEDQQEQRDQQHDSDRMLPQVTHVNRLSRKSTSRCC